MKGQEPKYIKVNGVTRLNPNYRAPGASSLAPQQEQQALPVYTSKEEYEKQMQHFGETPKLSESAQATQMIMQDEEIQQSIGSNDLNRDLNMVAGKYEIPFGLMNKLLELASYDCLYFLIDDSGSMGSATDTWINGRAITRWEEVRMRLLEMFELMAVVPTPEIMIGFLNRKDELHINRPPGITPQQFLNELGSQISNVFSRGPSGSTPYLQRMEALFKHYQGRSVAWYCFSDGQPDGGRMAQQRIQKLCLERANPERNPITFLSCTDEDDQVEWMKTVEEIAPYCSEADDYKDEKEEVIKDQGLGLPFTKGFYLISSLVAAMNPDDLDAMDESVPFTKTMLDNLLGFVSNEPDYRSYFDQFMLAQRQRNVEDNVDRLKSSMNWAQHYQQFLTCESHREIRVAMDFKQSLKNAAGIGGQGQIPSLSQPNSYGGIQGGGQTTYASIQYGQSSYGGSQIGGQSPYAGSQVGGYPSTQSYAGSQIGGYQTSQPSYAGSQVGGYPGSQSYAGSQVGGYQTSQPPYGGSQVGGYAGNQSYAGSQIGGYPSSQPPYGGSQVGGYPGNQSYAGSQVGGYPASQPPYGGSQVGGYPGNPPPYSGNQGTGQQPYGKPSSGPFGFK